MKRLAILATLLFALPLRAQTVANPSFESAATLSQSGSAGPWSNGPVPSWTLSGSGGLWKPTALFSVPMPDGATILWLNSGKATQDLGPVAANTTYTLSVWVGRRSDQYGIPTNSYTVSLSAGTTALCTQTAQLGTIPVGTFAKQSLSCPSGAATGNLSLALACNGSQCAFDSVAVSSPAPPPPPKQPDSITVKAQLLWCSICDHTDDIPATGNLVVAQTGGPSSTQNILTDGTVVMSGTIDIAQDPLEFTIYLTDENGASQPGANLTLKFPKFELDSPSFMFRTITLGIVRIAHTVQLNDTDCQAGCPAVRIVDVTSFRIGK